MPERRPSRDDRARERKLPHSVKEERETPPPTARSVRSAGSERAETLHVSHLGALRGSPLVGSLAAVFTLTVFTLTVLPLTIVTLTVVTALTVVMSGCGGDPAPRRADGPEIGGGQAARPPAPPPEPAFAPLIFKGTVAEDLETLAKLVDLYHEDTHGRPGQPHRDVGKGGSGLNSDLDPRSRLASTARERLDLALAELARKYAGATLPPDEALALCSALAELPIRMADGRTGGSAEDRAYKLSAAPHCRRFLDELAADARVPRDSADIRRALAVEATTLFRLGRNRESMARFEEFTELACGSPILNPSTDSDALTTETCRRALGVFLPKIYRELGELDKLLSLPERCASYRMTRARDLANVWQAGLDLHWKSGDVEAVDALAGSILDDLKWSDQESDVAASLIPSALASRARVRLLEGEFWGIGKTYLDYDWEHRELPPAFRRRYLAPAMRVTGLRARPLIVSQWFGRTPAPSDGAWLPGGDALIRPVLVAFLDSGHEGFEQSIARLGELDKAAANRAQLIALVTESPQSGTGPSLAHALAELETNIAVGLLDENAGPMLASYVIRHWPTLVLIDKKNRCVGYYAARAGEPLELDDGWLRSLEKLAAD